MNMTYPEIHILRGLPGSGKSTWVAGLPVEARVVVCSADDHRSIEDRVYEFKPEQSAEAHARCFGRFVDELTKQSADYLVVANTNVQQFEYLNYIRVAQLVGVPAERIYVQEMHINPRELPVGVLQDWAAQNRHRVPLQAIVQMAMRWED